MTNWIVLGTDRELEPAGRFGGVEMLCLEELLPRADVVSVHIPRREEGRSEIGADEIACMKDGVLLVNCARGVLLERL